MVKNCLHLKELVKIVENQNHVSSLFAIILFKTLFTTVLKYENISHLEFTLGWSEPILLCSGSSCLKLFCFLYHCSFDICIIIRTSTLEYII